MADIEITLPDQQTSLTLTHKETCWFARALIDWIERKPEAVAGRHYSKYFYEAEQALKAAEIAFQPIQKKRLQNLIAKGFDGLTAFEIYFLVKCFQHVWFPRIPIAQIRKLADQAKKIAEGKSTKFSTDNYKVRPGSYAKLLGLKTAPGSQRELQKLVGDYLILRRLAHDRTLVVSYMQVRQDEQARYPATFLSRNSDIGDAVGQVSDIVDGIMYMPPERPGIVFAVGKYVGTTQTRSTLLKPVLKPVFAADETRMDLMGIRLGLSWPHREPMGYRIWCSRITSTCKLVDGWQSVSRTYELAAGTSNRLQSQREVRDLLKSEPNEFFSRHVVGFQKILRWLSSRAFVELQPIQATSQRPRKQSKKARLR